ncbi:MAG TPA: hypothetical protein VGK22_21205 [Candidatus Angelobacter sp.]
MLFWDGTTGRISAEPVPDMLFVFPYLLLVAQPARWRNALLGVGLGFPLAAVLLADFANGFARGREAHTPYLSFACANLLLLLIVLRSWIAARNSARPGLIFGFAAGGFAYALAIAIW